MKVILLEDVYKQGVAGETVNVAPGFARNFLIPRSMAVQATAGAQRRLANLSKKAEVRRAERTKEYSVIAERIEAMTLYFGVKAGETGKLYGSVTSAEVADALQQELGLELDRRRIGDKPLRELGAFSVPVRLEAGIISHVRVIVHREGDNPQQAEAAFEVEEQAQAAWMAESEARDVAEEMAEEVDDEGADSADSLPMDDAEETDMDEEA